MRFSRTETLKRDAYRTASMMTKSGAKRVRIVGARGSWTVIANVNASVLAKFCAAEAKKACRV